jgi:hypothetical protein
VPRYLVLVPRDSEWYAATRNRRLVTTTERNQIALGRMEGRRPPAILISSEATVPTIDLVDLLTGDVETPAGSPES